MLRIVPAYGRDYRSASALRADWCAGRDFRIADMHDPNDGRYVNRQDYSEGPIQARYAGLAKVCIFEASAPAPKPPKPRAPKLSPYGSGRLHPCGHPARRDDDDCPTCGV